MNRISQPRLAFITAIALANANLIALAQDDTSAASPAGLSMLVLFLGIAAILGVFVIRWSQSAADDDD